MTRIRPDYVALLADMVLDIEAPPDSWRHCDGLPLTEAEIDMVMDTTVAEMCAVLRYAQRVTAHEQLAGPDDNDSPPTT